ncbi:MAG: hypothetical protein ACHQQR_13725 [Gemmatimonadales bacterium]
MLASAGIHAVRSYEDAATAIGRLDAAGSFATAGLRELLVLRCIATPSRTPHTGMIALVRADGEGDDSLREYAAALREGTARARGGALPSVASLHEALRLPQPAWNAPPIDELLRDTHERTPPVLKAALVALALRAAAGSDSDEPVTARLVALAVTLVLCVGGATTDAWLTLPESNSADERSLRDTFAALARDARAAQRGLLAAQELVESDERRVHASLGRAAYSALDVLALLRDKIVVTIPETARALGQTPPTAGAAIARLVDLGIAREVTGKARSRAFAYERIVRALEPKTDGAR